MDRSPFCGSRGAPLLGASVPSALAGADSKESVAETLGASYAGAGAGVAAGASADSEASRYGSASEVPSDVDSGATSPFLGRAPRPRRGGRRLSVINTGVGPRGSLRRAQPRSAMWSERPDVSGQVPASLPGGHRAQGHGGGASEVRDRPVGRASPRRPVQGVWVVRTRGATLSRELNRELHHKLHLVGCLIAPCARAQRPFDLDFEMRSAADSTLPWGWPLGWSAFNGAAVVVTRRRRAKPPDRATPATPGSARARS